MNSSYRTGQIADLLEKSTSSIRKWTAAIEEAGAVFMRDERNDRIYNEQDLAAFRHMKKVIASGRTTVEAARQAAALLNSERELRAQEGEVLAENDRQLMKRMADHIVALTQQNEAQAKELADVNRKLSIVITALNRIELATQPEEDEEVEEDANDVRTAGAAAEDEKSFSETEKTPEPKRRGLLSWFSRKK